MTPKYVKDLPKEIQDLYVKRQVEQGNEENREVEIVSCANTYGFTWQKTPEGISFWEDINDGNYSVFYERYPQTWEPKEGEVIEVSDDGGFSYARREYFLVNSNGLFWVKVDKDTAYGFKFARPLPTRHTVTQAQLIECYAKVNNISKDQIEVK